MSGSIGRYCELAGIPEVSALEQGMDFRLPQYRREVFLKFYEFHLRYRTHPGCVYFLMPHLANELGWSMEGKLWFAYINGNTQHPPTSYLIIKNFPTVVDLDVGALEDWYNANFARLGWDTDRRHQKSQFLACVADYRGKVVPYGSQENYFQSIGASDDENEYFRNMWKTVRNGFYSFGRLSTFSYLEYLRIMGLPLDCDNLLLEDMDGSKSHRNGLAIMLGRDDLDWHDGNEFRGKYAPGQISWLTAEAAKLLYEAKDRFKGADFYRDVSYFTLESAFCTYKSWHRPNRRYPGVYADMLYNRLTQTEKAWPEEDFGIFWDARQKFLPPYLRLENTLGDIGLKPEKQNWYRQHGCPPMMSWDFPEFANEYDPRIRIISAEEPIIA